MTLKSGRVLTIGSTIIALLLCPTLLAADAPATQPGWTIIPDPAAKLVKYAPNISMTMTVRIGSQPILPQRLGQYVGLMDNDPRGGAYELWNLGTQSRVTRLTGANKLRNCEISPDGVYLAGGGDPFKARNVIEVYSFRTNKLVQKIDTAGQREPKVIGFAGDRTILAWQNGFNTSIGIWDLKTGQKTPIEVEGWVQDSAGISPGGKWLAFINKAGRLQIHNTTDGKSAADVEVPPIPGGNGPAGVGNAKDLAFSPDGTLLVGYLEHFGKTRLIVWDIATGAITEDHAVEDRLKASGKGDGIQWLADNSGWMVGNQLIDRQSGKVVYELPAPQPFEVGRRLLGKDAVLVCPAAQAGKVNIKSYPLPRKEIEKAIEVVRGGGRSTDAALPPLTKADKSAMKTITPADRPLKALAPDAAGKPAGRLANAIALKGPANAGHPMYYEIRGVFFASPTAAQALVNHHYNPRGPSAAAQKPRAWADRINLATGGTVATIELPLDAEVMDLSADGTLMVVRNGDDRIDVFTTAATSKHVAGFRPVEEKDRFGRNKIVWAKLVDNTHLLTRSYMGTLVLWALPKCQAVCSIELSGHTTPALSANRKYLAASTPRGVMVFNSLTGEHLGTLGGRPGWLGMTSFSPDGTQLAFCESMFQNTTLIVYDMKTGASSAEVALPREARDRSIDWLAGGFVMVGRNCLVELSRGIVVWQYHTEGFDARQVGDPDENFWFVTHERDKLAWMSLPHEEARKAIAALKETDLAIRPGMKVSLDLSTATNDPASRQRCIESITKKLAANGITVADGQPVRLVGSVTTKAGRTTEYREIGGNRTETVTSTAYEARLTFEQDGKTLWECKSGGENAPPMVAWLKPGETVAGSMNKNVSGMGMELFLNAPLPRYVPKPRPTAGLGYSKLTATGVIPAEPPLRNP